MGPFDRFNDRAKRVLALSQDEAIRFGHNYIGPEHLLLGLIREGGGVAARVLDALGVKLSEVRKAVELSIGRGDPAVVPTEITLHPRTKKIVELALDEMRKLGHDHVGTEHLLLGVIREGQEGDGIAATVLQQFGASLEQVRHQVIETVGQKGAMAGAPPEVVRDLFDAQGRKRDRYCEDVLTGKLQVKKLYEDDRVLGFEAPYPQYQVHAVVIPKAHVASLMASEATDGELLAAMMRGVQAVAKALGMDATGFRIEANAIGPGVTPHMHWHVAAGPPLRRR